MKTIKYKIERIKIVSEKFNEFRQEIIMNKDHIVEVLKTLIEKYTEDFSLSKTNSVRKLKFYSIISRVKETDSFSEKLVRNNDYNTFDSDLINLESIDQPTLKVRIKELDDLIGIKILTDLNIDCRNMFSLIRSSKFISDAREKGILINQTDLESQPLIMRNGLDIYKLRCEYESWKFELQIKSKLDSAWGDMEHSIFYKDYKLTPVRDLAQHSMNHIGQLLIEIDSFLQEIREANDNFTGNAEAILFSNSFENKYSEVVSNELGGITFNFKKIAALSYNLKSSGFQILETEDLNFGHLSFDCEKYHSYIDSRNKDFDLQIFEAIVFSNFEDETTQDTIEKQLDIYFLLIIQSIAKAIISNRILQDEELAQSLTKSFFETCINFHCREFVLNTKNIFIHFENIKSLLEALEVLELEEIDLNNLVNLYNVFCFSGNLQIFLKDLDKNSILENLESAKDQLSKISAADKNISSNISLIINIIG